MYWKELYAEPGSSRLGLLGYGLLAVIFIVVCGFTIQLYCRIPKRIYIQHAAGGCFCEYAISMSTIVSCCGLLLLTARAAGSITSEKERDCWVSLISTPLEAGQIVQAKILGSIWSLRGLVPFLAVVWLPALTLRPSYFWGIVFSLLDLGILAAFAATLGVFYSQAFQEHAAGHGRRAGNRDRGWRRLLHVLLPVVAVGSRGAGDGMQVGFAPCMPFLLAWPGVRQRHARLQVRSRHEFGGFMAAY